MATVTPQQVEADALANLEERIVRAVQLVSQLRQERDEAVRELDGLKGQAESAAGSVAELRSENARLLEELEALRAERKQVRGRIEKLLGQMDALAQ